MKKIFSLLLAVALTVFVTGCKSNKKEAVNIVYSIQDSVTKFDPQIASNESALMIAENIFEGLVRFDENNAPYSEICENYTVSEDGLTYTFHLKNDLKWSDGRKLTSHDFKFGIERTLLKATRSDYASLFFSIKNAEKFYNGSATSDDIGIATPDEQTIIFHLTNADTSFLSILSSPAAYPCNEEFFNEMRGKYAIGGDKIISNGAFVINKVKDSYVSLRKNEYYAVADKVKPDNVYIYFNEDSETAANNILNGSRDIILYDGANISELQKSGATLYAFPKAVWGILFNLNDDVSKNSDFRKMLYYSLDIDVISRTFSDKYDIATGIVLPSTYVGKNNYRNKSTFNPFDFNMQKSAEHYANFIKSLDGYLPKTDIIYTNETDFKDTVARIVYNCQTDFDIYINPIALEYKDFDEKIRTSDFQIAFASFEPNTSQFSDMLAFFNDKNNSFGFNDEQFNKLSDATVASSPEELTASISRCEEYLVKDKTLFIPVAFENNYFITSKQIDGFKISDSENSIDFRLISKSK